MCLRLILLNLAVSCFFSSLVGELPAHAQTQNSTDELSVQETDEPGIPRTRFFPSNPASDTTATESNGFANVQQEISGRIPNVRSIGNSPDDVTRQLSDGQNTRVDSLFRAGPLTPLKRGWTKKNQRLNARGIALTLEQQYGEEGQFVPILRMPQIQMRLRFLEFD